MIDKISQAIIEEIQAFVNSDTTGLFTGATVMIDTDFNISKVPSYILPLIILEIDSASDSRQLIGGLTQMEWSWNLTVYAFEPDPYAQSDYGTGLLAIVDKLYEHFATGIFLTQHIQDIKTNYGFTYIFSGITKAQEIEKDNKIVIGRKIQFESVAANNNTSFVNDSTDNLLYFADNTIKLSVNAISMIIAGESKTFNIITTADWTIQNDQSWLTANVLSGSGNTTITLTSTVNSGSQRTANVSVLGTNVLTQSIVVTQAGV